MKKTMQSIWEIVKDVGTGVLYIAGLLGFFVGLALLVGACQSRTDKGSSAYYVQVEQRLDKLEEQIKTLENRLYERQSEAERDIADIAAELDNEIEDLKWDLAQRMGGVEDRTGDLEGWTEEISGRLENIEIDFYGAPEPAPEISYGSGTAGKYSSLFRDPEETDEDKTPGKYSSLFEKREP